MKAGFNLLLWCTTIGEAELKRCERLAEMGWDGVEVPVFEGDEASHRALGRRLDEMGLARTTVGIVSAEGADPLSDDAGARQKGIDHFRWLADCSLALGAETLCGPLTQPLGEFSGQGATDAEWDRLVEASVALADHTRGTGLTVAVEPLNRFECYALNTCEQAARLVEAVGQDHYGYLFDSFHANIEEKDPAAAVRHVAGTGTLRHVHVSENDRSTPGEGQVRWGETFAALKEVGYDGWLVIEAFGLAMPELAEPTKIWRRMYPSEEHLAVEGLKFMRAGME